MECAPGGSKVCSFTLLALLGVQKYAFLFRVRYGKIQKYAFLHGVLSRGFKSMYRVHSQGFKSLHFHVRCDPDASKVCIFMWYPIGWQQKIYTFLCSILWLGSTPRCSSDSSCFLLAGAGRPKPTHPWFKQLYTNQLEFFRQTCINVSTLRREFEGHIHSTRSL